MCSQWFDVLWFYRNIIMAFPRIVHYYIELLPPKTSFTEKTLVVSQHNISNILLNCDVITGNPSPRVSWWFNNKEIKFADRSTISSTKECDFHKRGFYRVTGVEDRLIICSVHYRFHAGRFECVASNKIGKDSGVINLVIKGRNDLFFNSLKITLAYDEVFNFIMVFCWD